jgi:hypothetical protein
MIVINILKTKSIQIPFLQWSEIQKEKTRNQVEAEKEMKW